MSGEICITSVRQVFNDGNHNGFTDLCRFRGGYYLGFRNCPDGHMVFPTSRILMLSSNQGEDWQVVYEFSIPNRDVRGPHFLVFQDKLFVYGGTWLCREGGPRDLNEHLGYAVWSKDGQTWHGPRMLEGTYGHFVWRAAAFGDKAYLNAQRKTEFSHEETAGRGPKLSQAVLLESEDGFIWKFVGLFREEGGSETAFIFEEDGAILAISRGQGAPASICRALPPYKQWRRKELDRNIGGPLVAEWGDRILVGGRRMTGPGAPKTALYWLVGDELQEAAELPSGGDNSYPGFVELSEKEGLLSYYSSHEGSGTIKAPSAIYLAKLSLK